MATFINRKIVSEKTLGERLQAARRRKHLTLAQAEEETKVRIRYLEALENGHFQDLPTDVYTIGFLVKYADFLNLTFFIFPLFLLYLINGRRKTSLLFNGLNVCIDF